MKFFFLILTFILFLNKTFSQTTDTTDYIVFFNSNLGYHIPSYDMTKWFGNNATIGAGFTIKNSSNFTFELSYNYIWGNDVKNQDSILQGLQTSEGQIIDGNGQYGVINFSETGWYSMFSIGKVIPIGSKHLNSGLWFKAGLGIFEHKILIKTPENLIPQIKDDYKKGYDKLSNGFAASQFIGYIWLSKTGVKNAFAGFEFVEAWTKSRRSVSFINGEKDNSQYFDLLMGVKIGWIISVYKRKPEPFYYN